MKIYISGKITGDRRYKAKFREVEKKLAAAGHIVLNPATARIYGDWQASEYLGDVLAELKPRRKVNLPDFPAIVRAAMADGMDICVYCQSFDCNECIVNEWKSERSDEE